MEKEIVDYILNDISCIIKNGLEENKQEFLMTNALAYYLTSNNWKLNNLDGIIYNALIKEYTDYILK